MTDREKVKLRGPVRNCVYESTMPDGKKFLTTMEYTLDGKLLTTRSVQVGGLRVGHLADLRRRRPLGQNRLWQSGRAQH